LVRLKADIKCEDDVRFLNRDKRAGPSAKVIKRILSSPNVPPAVRRKVEEYIAGSAACMGISVSAIRALRDQFHATAVTRNPKRPFVAATNPVVSP